MILLFLPVVPLVAIVLVRDFFIFHNSEFAPSKAAPKAAHVHRGQEQGEGFPWPYQAPLILCAMVMLTSIMEVDYHRFEMILKMV